VLVVGINCPASSGWQDSGPVKVGDVGVGEAAVDVGGAVPGQGLVRPDGVVLEPVGLGVLGQDEPSVMCSR